MYKIRKFSYHTPPEEVEVATLKQAISYLYRMSVMAYGHVTDENNDRICYKNAYTYDITFTSIGCRYLMEVLK